VPSRIGIVSRLGWGVEGINRFLRSNA